MRKYTKLNKLINPEIMRELYWDKGLNTYELEEKLGISRETIRCYLKDMKIGVRNKSERISGLRHPMYGKHLSYETRRKIGESNRKEIIPKERTIKDRIKIDDIEAELLEQLYLGNDYTMDETADIINCRHSFICKLMKIYNIPKKKKKPTLFGENHPNWNGGDRRRKHNTPSYKKWRALIFKRDKWTCQICHEIGSSLNAHHIKSWKDFPKDRYYIRNGITLCYDCHRWVHELNPLDFQ